MELWYPKAFRLDGPAWKTGYDLCDTRIGRGAVYHSMEGRWQAALGVLESSVESSWHLSLTYEGAFFQHYSLNTVTWHGGSFGANTRFVGVECEGRTGEPLSYPQLVALAEFTIWLAEQENWTGFYRHEFLWEHREMTIFGSLATSCPSNRIDWNRLITMATTIEELDKRTNIEAALRMLAAAAESNDMVRLIALLKYFGVLSDGVTSIKPSLS